MLVGTWLHRHPAPLDHTLKNHVEHLGTDSLHIDLVLNSAQECLVGQIARIEVCGEHHHHFEGNLKLHTVPETQIIHAPVERHDPAVQKVAWRHQLPAEIVDD